MASSVSAATDCAPPSLSPACHCSMTAGSATASSGPGRARGGATRLILEPLAFLRRLVSLVPSPRSNLVRYHAFAPNSNIRRGLLPRIERQTTPDTCKHAPQPDDPPVLHKPAPINPGPATPDQLSPLPSGLADESSRPLSLLGPAPDEDSLLTIRDRYLGWASLLKRVFNLCRGHPRLSTMQGRQDGDPGRINGFASGEF